jgi:hypothetical protein
MFNRRGQSILEYTVLIVIIIGVFVAMKDYIKRGIQGRWKTSVDDLGDQYDPRYINSNAMHTIVVNSTTELRALEGIDEKGVKGQWTNRVDKSHSIENKIESGTVAAPLPN